MTHRYVHDNNISPIYLGLYKRVFQLPAFDAIKERMLETLRTVTASRVTYQKSWYENNVEVVALLQMNDLPQEISFTACDNPRIRLDCCHLVTAEEVFKIYCENVGRLGKPIRPHGLVKLNTVQHGAAPRNKNAFAPWVLGRLFNMEEYKDAKKCAEYRLGREIMSQLVDDPKFVDFSEATSTKNIVERLKEFSHLPPSLLHRAIDLMYVEITMEG